VEQIPSWEANRSWGSQEFPHVLWNPKVHYRIHKSRPHVPILVQINSLHALIPRLEDPFLILSTHLLLGLPSVLFLSETHQNAVCTSLFSTLATCPAHLYLLDLVPSIIHTLTNRPHITQLLIMQFIITPVPAYLTFILTIILKHCQAVFFPECYTRIKVK
jgi:hypothetical protein